MHPWKNRITFSGSIFHQVYGSSLSIYKASAPLQFALASPLAPPHPPLLLCHPSSAPLPHPPPLRRRWRFSQPLCHSAAHVHFPPAPAWPAANLRHSARFTDSRPWGRGSSWKHELDHVGISLSPSAYLSWSPSIVAASTTELSSLTDQPVVLNLDMQLVDLDSPCRGGERRRTYDGGQAVVEAAATKKRWMRGGEVFPLLEGQEGMIWGIDKFFFSLWWVWGLLELPNLQSTIFFWG